MSNTDFDVNTEEVDRLLDSLDPNRYKPALVSTLRRSSNKVKREVLKSFRHLKNKHSEGRKGALIAYTKGGGRPLKPVYSKVFYRKTKNPFATITIRGNGATDFRALFFELGTKERKTRKGGKYRGSIQAGYYFRDTTKRMEAQTMREMESEAMKALRAQIRRQQR